MNINKNIINIDIYISFLGFIYVWLFNNNVDYKNILFLPFSYFLFNLVVILSTMKNKKICRLQYKDGIAFIIAKAVIFIRYVITPITIVYTENFSGIGIDPNKNSLDLAILLMVVELLMVIVVINIAKHYYSHKNIKINIENKNNLFVMPFNITLICFIIFSIILIVVMDYRLLIPKNIFLNEDIYYSLISETKIIGGIYVLADIVKISLLLICLSFVRSKYNNNYKWLYILMLLFILVLFIATITGTKRWDVLFAAILCLFVIKQQYKNIPRVIFVFLISLVVASIISISIYKFSWYLIGSNNPIQDIILYMLESFQSYFSGPRSVAQAIDMKTLFSSSISIATFSNDLLGSVPILSKYINQSNRINEYFNSYIGLTNTSQIIPMIGIGYCYFPVLSPILSMICEWFVIKMDFNIQRTNYIEFKFIYLYMALYLAMCMGFNTQIIFSFFITKFLPLYILFFINRKIVWQTKQ